MNRRSDQGCRCGQNTNSTNALTTAESRCSEQTAEEAVRCCHGCDNAEETVCSDIFCVEGCNDFVRQNIGALNLSGVGQVINASLTLCNTCPNRTIALGVTLSEVDRCGCETNIAFKTFEITTPNCGNRNIKVRDINFVVPRNNSNNGKRCFRLTATANYLDTNVCM